MIYRTSREILRIGLLLIVYLILSNILIQFEKLLCILGLLSITIASAEDTQHMLVILKVLNVKNVVVYTE